MYKLGLFFEWGGGCIFDVGPIEDKLNLSYNTKNKLYKLSEYHDTALDWDYPPNPSPWSKEQFIQFDKEANHLLSIIKNELGDHFDIGYEPIYNH